MRRDQTAHERLIPLLVEIVGAESYLEFGTHLNETIGRVKCERRYGVDLHPVLMPGIEFYHCSTADFIKCFAPTLPKFDFVFIDADHNADAVGRDFYGIMPFVADEGIICLHDTNPETVVETAPTLCGDAWKFAQRIFRSGYESVTLPYHPGLTIIRKRERWGPNE